VRATFLEGKLPLDDKPEMSPEFGEALNVDAP